MHSVEIRSRPSPTDPTNRARLTDLAAGLRHHWPDLRPPLTIEWSEDLRLVLDGEVPWVVGPAERDPQRGRSGSILPRRARAELNKIARSGVPFQRVAIAHELDPEGPVQRLLPTLTRGPRHVGDQEARLLVGPPPPHPGVATAVDLLDRAVHGATAAGRATAQLADLVLDPIVFGVIAPAPPLDGDLCLWYPLAAWRW